jgi:hypothetical protein
MCANGTVFHDVPLGVGPTNVDSEKLDPIVCSEIEVIAELLLIDFTSIGRRFFGLKNTQLIDTDAVDCKTDSFMDPSPLPSKSGSPRIGLGLPDKTTARKL